MYFCSGLENERTYIAIDLKSFYASVECVERGLDPLTTNLLVADESRTDKTICLAVSPSLKAYGISGRARLFEAVQRVKEVNRERLWKLRSNHFNGKSTDNRDIQQHSDWEVDYICALPRMALYIDYSTRVYKVYRKYVAPEHIHVYSVDEVFIDATQYLKLYKLSAYEFAMKMIHDVLDTTGITATAGIGTNMYLCKVAMDIVAKHIPADRDGVRIAELNEFSYRFLLWNHRPLTSFWRVGNGIADKLAMYGIDTMGKLARMSLKNEDLLYHLFGVNAELLIDHAWGWESCTMDYVKAYRPDNNSMSSGQVLAEPYTFVMARNVIIEMANSITLDLVGKQLVTDQLILTVSYDRESLSRPEIAAKYHGPVTKDYYGRPTPKHAHGTVNLGEFTSSGRAIYSAITELYDKIVNPDLLVRRLNICTNHVITEEKALSMEKKSVERDLFIDYDEVAKQEAIKVASRKKERRLQETVIALKQRFGKNSVLTGTNFAEGATARERNNQIGGHKA